MSKAPAFNFPDDDVMLEHGMLIYDALFVWVKSARGEVHLLWKLKKLPEPLIVAGAALIGLVAYPMVHS